MNNTVNQQDDGNPLKELVAFGKKWTSYFSGVEQLVNEHARLQEYVAKLEEEKSQLEDDKAQLEADKAQLEDALEQAKKGDEWSSRVTYENVVEQIAACEDTKERDEARKLIEPLLKRPMVTRFRRDIKRRVKELNDESMGVANITIGQAEVNVQSPGNTIAHTVYNNSVEA